MNISYIKGTIILTHRILSSSLTASSWESKINEFRHLACHYSGICSIYAPIPPRVIEKEFLEVFIVERYQGSLVRETETG
jgi:hypothetical protein